MTNFEKHISSIWGFLHQNPVFK